MKWNSVSDKQVLSSVAPGQEEDIISRGLETHPGGLGLVGAEREASGLELATLVTHLSSTYRWVCRDVTNMLQQKHRWACLCHSIRSEFVE